MHVYWGLMYISLVMPYVGIIGFTKKMKLCFWSGCFLLGNNILYTIFTMYIWTSHDTSFPTLAANIAIFNMLIPFVYTLSAQKQSHHHVIAGKP